MRKYIAMIRTYNAKQCSAMYFEIHKEHYNKVRGDILDFMYLLSQYAPITRNKATPWAYAHKELYDEVRGDIL